MLSGCLPGDGTATLKNPAVFLGSGTAGLRPYLIWDISIIRLRIYEWQIQLVVRFRILIALLADSEASALQKKEKKN